MQENEKETLRTERNETEKRSRRMPAGPGRKLLRLFSGMIGILIFGAAAFAAGFLIKTRLDRKYHQPVVIQGSDLLDGLRKSLSEGSPIMSALRSIYPNDLITYYDGAYVFVPIDYSLAMHDYRSENIIKNEDGSWDYAVNGRVISYKGIDVSSHQGEIDWEKVAGDGVSFAFIRALYRGYETGAIVIDKQARVNFEKAAAAGIKTGAYIFSQALNEEEVQEEMALLTELLSDYDIDCPVVVDVEEVLDGDARADKLSKDERTDLVVSLCEKIREAGYRPMIYFNYEAGLLMLDLSRLEAYDKWYASHTDGFYYPYAYSIRQYSDHGKINGINGGVDLNMAFKRPW